MNLELWSSGQFNDRRKKKQTTKRANHKMQCRCNDTGKSWRDANFKVTWYENRSRGTEFAYAIGGVCVMWYPRDAPT